MANPLLTVAKTIVKKAPNSGAAKRITKLKQIGDVFSELKELGKPSDPQLNSPTTETWENQIFGDFTGQNVLDFGRMMEGSSMEGENSA